MASIAVSNGVRTNLVSPLPYFVTFKKTNTDDTAFYEFTEKVISNNQANVVTLNLPGVWNVNISLNGKGSEPWDYFVYSLAAAPVSNPTGRKVEVTQAVYNALAETVYYHNLTSGEVVFTHKKVTETVEGAAKYYVYMNRGLFGTSVVALAANDNLAQLNKIVLVGKTGETFDSGYGIMGAFPMPDPGQAQDFASNA